MTVMPTLRRAVSIELIAILALWISATPCSGQDPSTGDAMPMQHHHPAAPGGIELFPSRDASGTGWQPDDSPMYGVHRRLAGWDVMLHGNLFAQFLYEPSDPHRTGGFAKDQFSSMNWGMAMARRPAGAGRVGLRGMITLEPWTVAHCGFINLLATGELCDGDTIHDRQHPHDLVMELAADYDRPLRGSVRWQVYGGLAGEPALGPAGFPHRVSALSNPVAPIAHHWLDSTHITFGLVTAGVYDRRWKAEMSVFNGREPDENRKDLDLGPLDSVSGRLSVLPSAHLAVQVSAGHLNEAEAQFAPQPRTDVARATASATYHRELRNGGVWATTLAWGVNSGREFIPEGASDTVTHALLLESAASLSDRDTWFGRAEIVQKPAHALHAHEFGASVFTVAKLQVGYVRYMRPWKGITAGLGGTASLSLVPQELESRYSGQAAPGFGVYLNVMPSRHIMQRGSGPP